jgi:hypothetical protein
MHEKVTEISNKLDDLSQKVTAIQDYLRSLAPSLMGIARGGPIVVSMPPWLVQGARNRAKLPTGPRSAKLRA